MSELDILFTDLFEQNKEKIFQLAYRFLGNKVDAEDVTQEVFIRAYKNYNDFRNESEIYSWLYRIAINLCKEKIRYKQRQKKHTGGELVSIDHKIEDENGENMEQQFVDRTDRRPIDDLILKETQENIRKEIERLPQKYAEVIILKELENMSYEEISKLLNISIDVIGVRLIRARSMLKTKLKKFL